MMNDEGKTGSEEARKSGRAEENYLNGYYISPKTWCDWGLNRYLTNSVKIYIIYPKKLK